MKTFVAVVSLLFAAPALGQAIVPPASVDLTATNAAITAAQTKADAAKAAADAVTAALPLPADQVPPSETVGGVAGVSTRYRRMDDVIPRITRASSCVTDSTSSCTVTVPALSATNANVIPIPINAGSQPILCNPTVAATTTSATVKCWTAVTTALNLGNVTSGLTLLPFVASGAGVTVQVTLLPRTAP